MLDYNFYERKEYTQYIYTLSDWYKLKLKI